MKNFFLTLLGFLLCGQAFSQISCSSFCADSVGIDTTGQNRFLISLDFSGAPSQFINYPWFPAVLHPDGDTIAKGQLEYFGQFGNSKQVYSAFTSLDFVPPQLNLIFRFDSLSCVLPYPCQLSRAEKKSGSREWTWYPNPAREQIHLNGNIPAGNLQISNFQGQAVIQTDLKKNSGPVSLKELKPGIYSIRIGQSPAGRLIKE